jgi:hypothetical protein
LLVFHTLPQQFDYLLSGGERPHRLPLVCRAQSLGLLASFSWLPARAFERLVKATAALVDAELALFTGRTYAERIVRAKHCNPLTADRLRLILERTGFQVDVLVTEDTSKGWRRGHWYRGLFSRHPILHRSLYGTAVTSTAQDEAVSRTR